VLSAAAEGGHVHVVTYLLSLEADINGTSEVRNYHFLLCTFFCTIAFLCFYRSNSRVVFNFVGKSVGSAGGCERGLHRSGGTFDRARC